LCQREFFPLLNYQFVNVSVFWLSLNLSMFVADTLCWNRCLCNQPDYTAMSSQATLLHAIASERPALLPRAMCPGHDDLNQHCCKFERVGDQCCESSLTEMYLPQSYELMRLPPRDATAEGDLTIPFQQSALKSTADQDPFFQHLKIRYVKAADSSEAAQVHCSTLSDCS